MERYIVCCYAAEDEAHFSAHRGFTFETACSSGRRFAFLPFPYDAEAAKLREVNIKFLEDGRASYKSGRR